MTTDITADIKKIIKRSILITFVLTIVISTIGLYSFFSEEAKTLEGGSGVGVFSIFNTFIAVIISILMLTTLNISRASIYKNKVRCYLELNCRTCCYCISVAFSGSRRCRKFSRDLSSLSARTKTTSPSSIRTI